MERKIKYKLNGIFKKRFNIDIEENGFSLGDEYLLGFKIGLKARHLLYVYMDIVEKFNIEVPTVDVIDGRFNTFNNIYEIIKGQLELNDIEDKSKRVG